MGVQFSYRTSISSNKRGVRFDEIEPSQDFIETWGKFSREFFITVAPYETDEKMEAAKFTQKDLPDLIAVAIELFADTTPLEKKKDILRIFYKEHGPIFEESLPFCELQRRLTAFLLAGMLWDITLPGEDMRKNRQFAAFFEGMKASNNDTVEMIPAPENIQSLLAEQPPVFTKSQKQHAVSRGIVFSKPPASDASPQVKMAWLQKMIRRFATGILRKNTTIDFTIDYQGNASVVAKPKNIYTLAILALLSRKSKRHYHKCADCGILTNKKKYCKACLRKHDTGYAKQRALAMFRKRKHDGKITSKEYEAVKKEANAIKLASTVELIDEEWRTRLEEYLEKIKKRGKKSK